MKKKNVLLLLFVFITLKSIIAQESQGLYTEVTFATRSIFHGWDIIGDNTSVFHPYIEDKIGSTGFAVAFWASIPMDRSYKSTDDLEFLLKYGNSVFKDSPFKIDFNSYADFIICPNAEMTKHNGSSQVKMLWKYNAGIAFKNLFKVADSPLVPTYNLFHFRPFGDIDFKSGSVHELGLFYTIPVLSKIDIGGTANYHTGVFGGGKGWTHITSKMSTSVKAGPVNISGAINYQWGLDVRTDVEDEFWMSLGVSKSF